MISSVGGYSLHAELGDGAMGTVWIGVKEGLTRAIKRIKPSPFPNVREANEKAMIKEQQALSHMVHPNIVRLYEFNVTKGTEMYLALELMRKETLFDVIKEKNGLPEDVARHCFLVILEALEHVHTRGYAHRDIKPENILLDAEFCPKLADFGLAQQMKPSGGEGRVPGNIGTPGYKAPEVETASATHFFDGVKSDIFSLGVVLFNMVIGIKPFNRATKGDPHYKALCDDPMGYWTMMTANFPHGRVSHECQQLLQGLLAVEPRNRPAISMIKKTGWIYGPQRTLKQFLMEQQPIAPGCPATLSPCPGVIGQT
jgi:serine/threonine protein kinase